VAFSAVVFKSCGQCRAFSQVPSSGFKSIFHALETGVEATRIYLSDIMVAGIATYLRRVGYQSHMGSFLVFGTAVTTVADNATSRAMCALDKLGIFKEDLLPYLQRR